VTQQCVESDNFSLKIYAPTDDNTNVLFTASTTPTQVSPNFAYSGSLLSTDVSQRSTTLFPYMAIQFSAADLYSPDVVTFIASPKSAPPITVTLQRRMEADIFLRDPDELYQTLISDSGNLQWPNDARTASYSNPWSLPDAITLSYPSVVPGTDIPGTNVLYPVENGDFWPTPGPYIGPATDYGLSIKAANVWKGGLCSQFVPLQALLLDIVTQVQTTLLHRGCGVEIPLAVGEVGGGMVNIDARMINATTQMRHGTPIAPTNFNSGFMVNLNVGIDPINSTFDECNIDTVYTYDAYVQNGLLTVGATQDTFNDGSNPILCHHCGQGNDSISKALGETLPTMINDFILSKQQYNRDTDPTWTCDPNLGDPCSIARTETLAAINSGAANIGLDKSNEELVSQLRNTVSVQDGSGNYVDWSCDQRIQTNECQAPQISYKCDFTVRVNRINVRPDGIEVVEFDDLGPSSPLALLVASFNDITERGADGGVTGGFNATGWQQVCCVQAGGTSSCAGPSTDVGDGESQNFFARRYASALLGEMQCPFSGGNPEPYGNVAPACSCQSAAGCYSGECANAGRGNGGGTGREQPKFVGLCVGQCVTDMDCPGGGHCYQDRGLCSGTFGACAPWEQSVPNADGCQNAGCVECGGPGQPCCNGTCNGPVCILLAGQAGCTCVPGAPYAQCVVNP
jgi:hypothetical protein